MKITIDLPDDKAIFFLELVKNLNFSVVDNQLELDIPDFHKSILEERIEAYKRNPDDLLDWEDVKKGLEEEDDI